MALRLGILAKASPRTYALRMAAKDLGFHVVYCDRVSFREARTGLKPDVDGWLIPSGATAKETLGSHPFIDRNTQAVTFIEEDIPTLASARFTPWKRRLAQELADLERNHARLTRREPASRLWVLAASTGGLEAVGDFLARVSPDVDAAFLYVQHIAQQHVGQLLRMVERRSQWRGAVAETGQVPCRGWVTVVSPAAKLRIAEGGALQLLDFPWTGQYAPNIDDVAGQVAREYGACGGMIVFTGMGYDGVVGSRMVRHRGGEVWVQAPETCAAPALPEAVLGAQAVDYTGSVVSLAEHFNEKIKGATDAVAAEGH